MPACQSCAREVPSDARFCPGCGAPQGQATPDREVRKTVTVLFSDMTGSTALGEHLDAEEMRALLARTFAVMRESVERHGGTVEKFIGDAVMAVFGLPIVHEDDALRAVRAALDMRAALERLGPDLANQGMAPLLIRTGINTGEVVAGRTGETLVTGDAVNVAARLEQSATPGQILLGEATYALVHERVVADPVEALRVHGKSAPLAAYELRSADAGTMPTPRDARSDAAPIVGRTRELRLLRDTWEDAQVGQRCRLLTIVGNPGVGKSRLVREFVRETGSAERVLRGRCLPYGEGITYWPVAEMVREAAGIEETDDASEALARIEALLADRSDGSLIARRVAQLIGIVDEPAPREELHWGVRHLLESLAASGRPIVVFDDIHWAEPALLDLIEHITDWSRDAPMLIICMARPDLLDLRPGWAGGKLNAATILLEALSAEAAETLLEELGGVDLPAGVRTAIAERAEGNPLFLEETIAMLRDEGRLQVGKPEAFTELRVPTTIQALIAARLDRLAPGERVVAERASVVGRVFERGAVAELAPELPAPELGDHLVHLVRKEFLRPEGTGFAGDDAFRFRHLLIRDTAYDSLPKRERADLHERCAAWLERVLGERAPEYAEIIGFHYEQAAGYRRALDRTDPHLATAAGRASLHLGIGGERALRRGDVHAATGLLSRAIALAPDDLPELPGMLAALGVALTNAGDLPGAEETLDRAIAAASAAGDERVRLRAGLQRRRVAMMTTPHGWAEQAEAETLAAIERLEVLEDHEGLAQAWEMMGWVANMRGSEDDAVIASEQAIAESLLAGQGLGTALQTYLIGIVYGSMPIAQAAERLAALEAQASAPAEQAWIVMTHSYYSSAGGEFDTARREASKANDLFEELGQRVWLSGLKQIAGMVEMEAGRIADAETDYRDGYQMLRAIGEQGFFSTVAALLADTVARQGRLDEAAALVVESRSATAPDDAASQALWRMAQARVEAGHERWPEAVALLDKALEVLAETDFVEMRGHALLQLAESQAGSGDREAAASAAMRALEAYQAKGLVTSAGRAEALLRSLEGRPQV